MMLLSFVRQNMTFTSLISLMIIKASEESRDFQCKFDKLGNLWQNR